MGLSKTSDSDDDADSLHLEDANDPTPDLSDPTLLIDLQYIDVLMPLLASLLSQHFLGRFADLFLFRDQIKHR